MTDNILPFLRQPYPDVRELRSLDGPQRWNARVYLPDHHHELINGQTYTLTRLIRDYGMVTQKGKPALRLEEGESMPAILRFTVEAAPHGE